MARSVLFLVYWGDSMTRVMLVTFAVLGWAWFELSGGTEFIPGENGVDLLAEAPVLEPRPAVHPKLVLANAPITPAAKLAAEAVTRDDSPDLAGFAEAQPRPNQVKTVFAPAQTLSAPSLPSATLPAAGEKLASLDQPAVISDAVVVQSPVVLNLKPVDYRSVTGSRVNLRQGPSTDFDVVTQLLRGEEVEVLDSAGDGWVKLRALDGSDIGWMSDSFLSAANN